MSKKKLREMFVLPSYGNTVRKSGAGPHDPRPNRERSRGDRERAAMREQE